MIAGISKRIPARKMNNSFVVERSEYKGRLNRKKISRQMKNRKSASKILFASNKRPENTFVILGS
jgi:hypothetical protein